MPSLITPAAVDEIPALFLFAFPCTAPLRRHTPHRSPLLSPAALPPCGACHRFSRYKEPTASAVGSVLFFVLSDGSVILGDGSVSAVSSPARFARVAGRASRLDECQHDAVRRHGQRPPEGRHGGGGDYRPPARSGVRSVSGVPGVSGVSPIGGQVKDAGAAPERPVRKHLFPSVRLTPTTARPPSKARSKSRNSFPSMRLW